MLQAKDLMIGDWVWYDNQPYQIRKLGIYDVDRDGEDYPAVCVGKPNGIGIILERNEIGPIPLSRFVLERLGFDVRVIPDYDDVEEEVFYKAVCRCKDNRGCDVEVEYRTDRNEIRVLSHHCENVRPIRQVCTQIRFVHELRHLFVLFGIEKEIAL